jgi:uncharacterized membrane protein YfcA
VKTPLIPGITIRKWVYPACLSALLILWGVHMAASQRWGLFEDFWPMSLTMVLGSFVAGSTPNGGAAVAFPVFTKLLAVPTEEARTFGLMIQSVGMTMATIMILVKRVRILPRLILWTSLGGGLGQVLGTYALVIPNPYPRILFTVVIGGFGVALAVSRWALKWQPIPDLPRWGSWERALFVGTGVLGGVVAAHIGTGLNMLVFILLTLAFGIDIKISTPTSVIIMALNSLVGFALHGAISQDIGIVWQYWLVCVPIVAVFAPIGAIAAAWVGADAIIAAELVLIAIELVSTVVLIPFTPAMLQVTAVTLAGCALAFYAMLAYRQRGSPVRLTRR